VTVRIVETRRFAAHNSEREWAEIHVRPRIASREMGLRAAVAVKALWVCGGEPSFGFT
jgi:hypothetical protein